MEEEAMLFGRGKACGCGLWGRIVLSALLLAEPMRAVAADGSKEMQNCAALAREFGAQQNQLAFSQLGKTIPDLVQDEEFDAVAAYDQVSSGVLPQSEHLDFLSEQAESQLNECPRQVNQNETFITQSESAARGKFRGELSERGVRYRIHRCKSSGGSYPLTLTRSRKVTKTKICIGHFRRIEYRHKSDAVSKADRLSRAFSSKRRIADSNVQVLKEGRHKYIVQFRWTHRPNVARCTEYRMESKPGSDWRYDDPSHEELVESPDCELLGRAVLDDGREELRFLYRCPQMDGCAVLRSKDCELIDSECIKKVGERCVSWENTFRCYAGLAKLQDMGDITEGVFVVSGDEEETQEPSSFPEVMSRVAVLAAVEEELETSGSHADQVGLFTGSTQKCSKSVLENVLYDCCKSMQGLATDLNLAKCSGKELALAERREQGKCHYVGKYSVRTLGMKTETKHVYCCFNSKLGRVVQEESHKQLKLSWGSPKSPKCRGISTEELAKVDFSQMDMRELLEDQIQAASPNIDAKVAAFERRLRELGKEAA